MPRTVAQWQKTINRVVSRFRKNAALVLEHAPFEARKAVAHLIDIQSVEASSAIGDAAFRLDKISGTLYLGVKGLDLIWEAGKRRKFKGLAPEEFCQIAVSVYLYHEVHHIAQRLIEFSDVQAVKRTAGLDKLGELDVIADAVAAQIFATLYAGDFYNDPAVYAATFLGALEFMIEFCFPAFGFPLQKRHKVQRAFGIVLMAILTERAIRSKQWDSGFDSPLFPSFSKRYREMIVLSYSGNPSISIVQFSANLHAASVKEMLKSIDSGDVKAILERGRQLV